MSKESKTNNFIVLFFNLFTNKTIIWCHCTASITGSIISSTVLRPVVIDNETILPDLSVCGAYDCPSNNVTNANLAVIDKTTVGGGHHIQQIKYTVKKNRLLKEKSCIFEGKTSQDVILKVKQSCRPTDFFSGNFSQMSVRQISNSHSHSLTLLYKKKLIPLNHLPHSQLKNINCEYNIMV